MAVYLTKRLCVLRPQSLACLASTNSFKASDIQVTLCKDSERRKKPDPNKLVFGHEFTDHMFEVEWRQESGWGKPQIRPLHNLSLHPAAKVLHYANEVFEGLKAYYGTDGKIRMFRPDQNAARMLTSARRAVLPEFDGNELVQSIRKLISIDKDWVPKSQTSTLYIRPTLIGTESSLGVSVPTEALLYVIAGPVGPYFPTGFKPVTLLADSKYVRSWIGGAGLYKMGSNYAPTVYVQLEAQKKYNCQQVLWLYGDEQKVTEVGTMNVFVLWTNEKGEKELITPSLDSGLILPGVTRRSLIELAQKWGEFKVSEKDFTMKELAKALKQKRVHEMFGAGTACIVCPVEKIIYEGKPLPVPTMDAGAPVTMRFHKELTDIQFGRAPSNGWMVEVD